MSSFRLIAPSHVFSGYTLSDILNAYTTEPLRKFVMMLGGPASISRKADRIAFITRQLLDPASFRRIWRQMTPAEREMIAFAYHHGGTLDLEQYLWSGKPLVERSKGGYYSYDPMPIDLFLGAGRIPLELMPLLEEVLPPAQPFRLTGPREAPASFQPYANSDETVPLLRADTEEAGLHDLRVYLHLLSARRLKLTVTGNLNVRSLRLLLENAMQDDFLPLPEDKPKFEHTIRPFGLVTFARESGLVTLGGNLTPEGEAYLDSSDPALLLAAFERWEEGNSFDELQRLPHIRGKRARRVRLTPPAERRGRIIEALSWCPVGEWLDVYEFYRAMHIWELDFTVEEPPGDILYVGRRSQYYYYEAWADSISAWYLIEGQYTNVVLWEYLATLGALDILYTEPEEAVFPADPYGDYDELYYSRYDGLKYFRITPLGAYLFGQSGEYTPRRPETEAPLLRVASGGTIEVLDAGRLTPALRLQLEEMARPEGETRYHLEAERILPRLEEGKPVAAFRSFLQTHSKAPLPPAVEAWFETQALHSRAFQEGAHFIAIKVRQAGLLEQLLQEPTFRRLCRKLDDKTLLVAQNKLTAFHKALRKAGYGLQRRKR